MSAAEMVRHDGLGAMEHTSHAEMAARSRGQAQIARVESRFKMALLRPRDLMQTRQKLLDECKRPGFAAVALYKKPIGAGKFVEGPSIRFAEAAIRYLGNIEQTTETVFDDGEKQSLEVSVLDLENNVSYSDEVLVTKVVEQRELWKDQVALSVRTNSQGERTFLVAANEERLANKRNALVSKALRNCGVRVLPGDIKDECMAQCRKTMADEDAKDPSAAMKAIADSFAGLKVYPADLKAYLGHDIATCSPAEMTDLRGIYAAINDRDTSWAEVMAAAQRSVETGKKEQAAGLLANLERRKAARAEKAAQAKAVAEKPKEAEAKPAAPPETEDEKVMREAREAFEQAEAAKQ